MSSCIICTSSVVHVTMHLHHHVCTSSCIYIVYVGLCHHMYSLFMLCSHHVNMSCVCLTCIRHLCHYESIYIVMYVHVCLHLMCMSCRPVRTSSASLHIFKYVCHHIMSSCVCVLMLIISIFLCPHCKAFTYRVFGNLYLHFHHSTALL